MAIPDLFGSGGGGGASGSFPQNSAGEDYANKYYDPYSDVDTGRKRGAYSEVDEDAPYNPLEIDRSGYDQQTAEYNQWLSRQRALLERDGGMGAQQMRAGMNQAQLAMQAQATGRGANPGNERAALYAGGQMQRAGAIDAAQLTAQEMAQMQQMQSGAYAQQAQAEMDWQSMEMQRQEMMANQYAAMVTGDIAETSNDWNRGSGMVGTVIGAAAGAAASDVRVKQDMTQASPAAQDATIRGMGSNGTALSAGMRIASANTANNAQPMDRDPERNKTPAWVDSVAEQGSAGAGFASGWKAAQAFRGMSGGGEAAAGTASVAGAGASTAATNSASNAAGYYASDVRAKQGIAQAGPGAQDATIRGLDAYQYDYRPEYQDWAAQVGGLPAGAKDGRQTGIMAQDLERTPLGQTMVSTDPQTGMLAIDGGQAVTTSLGLIGRLGERADELERRLAELEAQRQAAAGKGKRRA
jgi:hypothetical protein